MAKGQFYIVYMHVNPDVTPDDVKKKMDLAVDWFRIDPKVWVVYTTSNAEKWHARLEPLVVPDGNLLINKLDMSDQQGWITERFWEWLKEGR